MSSPPVIIGVDTGGTFTDLVLVRGRRIATFKTPSTPHDFSVGVLEGIDQVRAALPGLHAQPFTLIHSTTVATNALLEGKGAAVGLITTEGFRDVLEIGRQDRPSLYDLNARRPPPLVPRRRRLEADERVTAEGEVLRALDPEAIDALLDRLQKAGVESIAVSLLYSFLHPAHERLIARAAARRKLPVSLSSEVNPEFREYERTSTTVANAFVSPVMQRYLSRIQRIAKRQGAHQLRVVQSNGGTMSPAAAGRTAVQTLLSGPAAGMIGVLAMLRQSLGVKPGQPVNAITFDMGGTSTDVSLITHEPQVTHEHRIGGHPVRVPMMDIHTVGAGGGSIARLDAGGALHVGPESAGADPGPACYGRGEAPTVTDANLVLGRLATGRFLGGRMALDETRARNALAPLAQAMGATVEQTATAILRIVNANMERAIRVISVERGFDPRSFVLAAFGGAGGLHTCALAESLGIPRVFLPRHPGVLSAWGAVCADVTAHTSQTLMLPFTPTNQARITRLMRKQEQRVRRTLRREGVIDEAIRLDPRGDLRYQGQSYELTLPLTGTLAEQRAAFDREHLRRYGHAAPGEPIELVTLRMQGTAPQPQPRLPRLKKGTSHMAADSHLDRDKLAPGSVVSGPRLITEAFSTLWLPEGWTAIPDDHGHLWLSREGGG